MNSNRLAGGFATLMLIGSAPYVLFIAILGQIILSHEPGTPSGGNALGVMMIFLWAYGVALISCVMGLIYFGYAALRHKFSIKTWHRATIWYCIVLALSPVVYFISQ